MGWIWETEADGAAAQMLSSLRQASERNGQVRLWADGQPHDVMSPDDLYEALENRGADLIGSDRAELHVRVGTETFTFMLTALQGGALEVEFTDGTRSIYTPDGEEDELDAGLALLDPITADETARLEGIIGELYRAAGLDSLTPDQEERVLALADLIRWQRDQMVPDVTPRWTLVGVVRSGLLRLAVEVPVAVAADQIGITLREMGWSNIAHGLRIALQL